MSIEENNHERLTPFLREKDEKKNELVRFQKEIGLMESKISAVKLWFSGDAIQHEGWDYYEVLKGKMINDETVPRLIRSLIKLLILDVDISSECIERFRKYGLERLSEIRGDKIKYKLSRLEHQGEIVSYIKSFLDVITSMCATFQARLQNDIFHIERETEEFSNKIQASLEKKEAAEIRKVELERSLSRITHERVSSAMEHVAYAKHSDGFFYDEARQDMERAGLKPWKPARVVERILELAGYKADRIRIRSHNRTWVVLGTDGRPVHSGRWGDVLHSKDFEKAYAKYRLERRSKEDLEED